MFLSKRTRNQEIKICTRRWRDKKLVQTFGFEIGVEMRKLWQKVRLGLCRPISTLDSEILPESPKNRNKIMNMIYIRFKTYVQVEFSSLECFWA